MMILKAPTAPVLPWPLKWIRCHDALLVQITISWIDHFQIALGYDGGDFFFFFVGHNEERCFAAWIHQGYMF